MQVDSRSVGDATRFCSLRFLAEQLPSRGTPADAGWIKLIVHRLPGGGIREYLDQIELTADGGLPSDKWNEREKRNPQMQMAVMQFGVAELIANGQPLALFGDQLFLDLDLSTPNLPPGSRLALGDAIVEVTPYPHNGCRKFQARFGSDALEFVSAPETRHLNLRGIYMRVIEPGIIRRGDPIKVLSRPTESMPQLSPGGVPNPA